MPAGNSAGSLVKYEISGNIYLNDITFQIY